MALPRYKVTIIPDSDEFELEFLSLVSDPAIEIKALAFKKELKMFFSEDEKQIIAGPALIPDLPIYRRDEATGFEYEVVFTAEDIEMIVEAFNRNTKKDKINLEHTDTIVESAFIKGNWIVGVPDKSQAYGFELPIGSWFVETKVTDKQEWLKLKEGGHTSYSIEGVFRLISLNMNKQKQINNNNKLKLMEFKLKDGTVLSTPDEVLAEGSKVFVVDPETGEETIAPDGSWELEDGRWIECMNGVCTSIKEVEMTKTPEELASEEEAKKKKMKYEITENDVAALWMVFEPKIKDMIDAAFAGLEMSKVEEVRTELSKQIEGLTERLDNKPAATSIKKVQASATPLSKEEQFKKNVEFLREYNTKKN